jgi:glycosyltransferase involved in cell wall biosynthesis
VAEASVARRRAEGPWAAGYAASFEALAAADLVLAMTRVDRAGLASVVPPTCLVTFPPFLDAVPFAQARAERARHRARLAAALGLDPGLPWLLAVAMMRPDAKRDSYGLLADALARLGHRDWRLVVVGDGAAAAEVRALLAPFGEVVRFTGALDEEELPPLYAACDLYVWPAVAEAYGMTLLEAQAAGLPVLAGDEGGVPDIVADGVTGRLAPRRDPAAFAAILADLLARPDECQRLGRAAAARIAERHALPTARQRLATALDQARRNRAARAAEALPCACA